ncbi:Protein arginine N-methyltransferase 9 (Protein arginine N-methyltransferase 10) [Durusdinium trenchii]|uniref:Protein arginine N-methyltransferase 9 (Protein arginine N-methyltransferase 10) n=1 Tax=Durusdinium trenchii TaxID=1381693 RepID=A0ABP0IQT4_9DINO
MSGVELPVRTPFGNSIARLRNNGDHSIEGDSLRPDLVFAVTFFETPSLVPSLRPDGLPETHAALAGGGGPEEALRRLLGEAAGAFQDESLWSKEGPGRLLEQSKRMAALDALPARAKELAQRGPGTLGSLLCAIAEETFLAAKGCEHVLVIGGHGISAVSAARAGARAVVLWEPLEDVACAAREVLRRNLKQEEVRKTGDVADVALSLPPGSLVVVDRWHGLGVLGWCPLLALRQVLGGAAAPSGVVPSKLSISLALADAGLHNTQGLDLSGMDARFRPLSVAPLKVGVGEHPHPTSLRPKLLTDFVQAFDYDARPQNKRDLARPAPPSDGPKPLAFSAKPSKVAATAALFECRFELPRSKGNGSLRFAQWLPGALQLKGADMGLCAWRNDSRVWLEWDAAKSLHPPFGFMALSDWYFEMLRDSARHELYERALQVEITKKKETSSECKVLDVGSGDGILSLMALRAGATSGLGVEYVAQIARASEEVVAENRRAEADEDDEPPVMEAVPETPLEIRCTDVRGIEERPEKERFEVLVTELMDASGLGETLGCESLADFFDIFLKRKQMRSIAICGKNLIALTEGSKRRLCKSDCAVIPNALRLKAVLCEVKLPDLNGVNIDAFWPFWPLDRAGEALWLGVDLDKMEGEFKVLTDAVELFSLSLGEADVDAIPTRASYNFTGIADGTANMVVWWFEAQLSQTDPSVVLTNAPSSLDGRHSATCWGQAAAEIPHVQVHPGQATEILMELAFGEYQLKFKVPGAGSMRGTQCTPPPHVEDYSEEYRKALEDHAQRQKSYLSFAKESRVGQTAIRNADVEAIFARTHSVAALQQCALAMALFPGSFGVEAQTANRILVSWYTVGGEGRS